MCYRDYLKSIPNVLSLTIVNLLQKTFKQDGFVPFPRNHIGYFLPEVEMAHVAVKHLDARKGSLLKNVNQE